MKLQVIFRHAAAIFMMAVAGSSLAAESPGAEQAKDLLNKAVAFLEKGVRKGFLRIQRSQRRIPQGTSICICDKHGWSLFRK